MSQSTLRSPFAKQKVSSSLPVTLTVTGKRSSMSVEPYQALMAILRKAFGGGEFTIGYIETNRGPRQRITVSLRGPRETSHGRGVIVWTQDGKDNSCNHWLLRCPSNLPLEKFDEMLKNAQQSLAVEEKNDRRATPSAISSPVEEAEEVSLEDASPLAPPAPSVASIVENPAVLEPPRQEHVSADPFMDRLSILRVKARAWTEDSTRLSAVKNSRVALEAHLETFKAQIESLQAELSKATRARAGLVAEERELERRIVANNEGYKASEKLAALEKLLNIPSK